jgi:copper homeostasis protein (lipoprotein)
MRIMNLLFVNILCGLMFSFIIGATGCSPKIKTDEAIPKGDNSMVSLDWDGTYKGTIPCADCQGIETSLTLNKDNTYLRKTKYIGKSDIVYEKTGTFTWNKEGSTIILKGISNEPNQYVVGENILFQLDMSGKRITGNLADSYNLRKVQ